MSLPKNFVYPRESQFPPWQDPEDPSNRSQPRKAPPKTMEIVVGRQESPEKPPPANKLRVTTKRHLGPLVPIIPDNDPVPLVKQDASGDGSKALSADDGDTTVGDSSDQEEADDVDMGSSDAEQPLDSKGKPRTQKRKGDPTGKANKQPPVKKVLTGGKPHKQHKNKTITDHLDKFL